MNEGEEGRGKGAVICSAILLEANGEDVCELIQEGDGGRQCDGLP